MLPPWCQGITHPQHYGKFPNSRSLNNREIGKKGLWGFAWRWGAWGYEGDEKETPDRGY